MNSSMNNLIPNPFHSTCGDDDEFSSMLIFSMGITCIVNNLILLVVIMINKLSTINISMSTSEPQLTRQSIENLNNLFTD